MQRDMLGCIWPNTWLDRVLLAPSFEPEPLAGGVNYHHEPPAVMMARRIDGLCNLRTPGALPGEAAFSSCNYGSYPPARVMFLNTFGSGPAPQAAAPQMNTVTPGVGYGNDGGGSPVGAGIWAGPPAPSPTHKTMQGASPSDLGLGRSDPGSHHRSRSSHGAPGYDQTCQSVPNGRAMRHSQRGAARDPAVQLERNVRVLAARLLKEGADRVAVNLLCEQIFHSEVSAEALMVKAISRKHSTGMRGKYCLLLRDVKMADGSKGYCCLLCPQSHRKGYKNPQDSIRHFKKAHFGLALDCKGGWYVSVSQGEIHGGGELSLPPVVACFIGNRK